MAIGIIVWALTIAGAPPALQADTRTAAPAPAPAPAAAPAPQAIKDDSKPICRRYAEMGSNIRRRKLCMNKAQWDAMARESQAVGRSMQPALSVSPGGQ